MIPLSEVASDTLPAKPLSTADFESLARARAEHGAWDFLQGGSEDEVTLRANVSAYRRIALKPRVLAGIAACDTTTTALGAPLRSPIMVAPIGYQRLLHPDGEQATARGATAAGTLMVASTMSNHTLEDVAAAASGPLWFQLYVMKDPGLTRSLVERAEAARYRAIVVTVDAPRLGRRERDLRNGFSLPVHLRPANLPVPLDAGLSRRVVGSSAVAAHAAHVFDPAVSWRSVEALCAATCLPIVVKGILDPEDAKRAIDVGAAAIVVSNHGGRQLDGAAATIDALGAVVRAVAGRCEVYVDGGIRRGTDALKARALGARAVFVGRPAMWGLLADGERGVHAVLDLLREELEAAMHLAGRASWEAVDESLLLTRGGDVR